MLKVRFIQDCPVKHRVLAAVLKDFKRLVAASGTDTRPTCILSQCFCQAQPTPSSNWAELPLFSLSTAYGQDGLQNITYGLHNIVYGLHNPTYELHNPACGLHNHAWTAQHWESNRNSLLVCYKCLAKPQLQLVLAQVRPSLSFTSLHPKSTPDLRKCVLKNNIWSTPDFFPSLTFINIWSTPDMFFQ